MLVAEELLDELFSEIKSQIGFNKKVTCRIEEFKKRPFKENMESIIGRNLSLARRNRGISQNQLGNLLGVTFQQIQKYENGKNRISASRLYEVSKILAYPYEFFFKNDKQGERFENKESKK